METPEKIPYISGNGNPKKPLIFREMEFLSTSSKNKKNLLSTKSLYFQEVELSSSNIKKFLIFSQKKAFLIFREMELSYKLGNGNPGKNHYISEKGNPGKIL